jgi:catalase
MKFPDVIHAAKPEPDLEIPQAQTAHNNFWDFINLRPESSHMFLWAMSDRGIPRSYRMMQGFGVNTFTLINAEGKRTFVKFTWTPTLGVHSLVWDEALKIAGQDPDFHRRDLADAIGHGVFPTWKFGIQTCEEEKADDFDFDILDATKVWPEELFPIRYIGEIQLNKNPEEYFPQVEQAAFCTAHVVPGIGFSDDPLLQTRNFSYFDTQLSRLGVNWQQLPVNRPVCPVMNFNRDGAMQHRIQAGKTNYWPNRHSVVKPATAAEGAYIDYPEKIVAIKQRLLSKKFGEHFSQAQLFWNSMSPHEKTHIIDALGFELDHCDDPLVYEPMVQRLADIDLGLAQAVAEKVGAPVPEKQNRPNHGRRSKGLSQTDFTPEALGFEPTIATRMIGILIADGFNYSEYEAVKMALTSAGALCFTIGPKRSPVIPSSGGKGVRCEHHFEGMRSTAFDSLYIPGGKEGVQNLMKRGRAVHVRILFVLSIPFSLRIFRTFPQIYFFSLLLGRCRLLTPPLTVDPRSLRPPQSHRCHRRSRRARPRRRRRRGHDVLHHRRRRCRLLRCYHCWRRGRWAVWCQGDAEDGQGREEVRRCLCVCDCAA